MGYNGRVRGTARRRGLICRQPGRVNMGAAPVSGRAVTILAVSDEVDPLVYSDHVRERFRHVDLVLSCGDLPYSYLDYIVSMLDVPLYGVRGNHDCGQGFA